MSDVLTIRNAIVAKLATVAGVKAAYQLMPDALPDGPVAVVIYEGTDVVMAASFEELEHQYGIDLYIASLGPAYTEKTLLPFVALVVAEFRTGRTLGGLVEECVVTRVDALDTVTVNEREYDRLPLHLRVRDAEVVSVGI